MQGPVPTFEEVQEELAKRMDDVHATKTYERKQRLAEKGEVYAAGNRDLATQ